ncbi:unnamed protein product [Prunus armeniaca]
MIQTDRLYSADDLYTIRQRKDEPLREFAARFSHEYSRCPETDGRAAYIAFKSGLQSSHFQYLVHSSNWRTYDELMKQAAIHAKAEYFNSKPERLTSLQQGTSGRMTEIISREVQRRNEENTVTMTTEHHCRITIACRKSLLC